MDAHDSRGFTLIEALIAALLVAIAIGGFAQLLMVGSTQVFRTRQSATALTLAQAKLEEFRGFTWRFDPDGQRVSAAELAPSPPSTLQHDQPGYVEPLDRFGAPAAGEGRTHYRRRWAVAPIDAADPDTLSLQVCVFSDAGAGEAADTCVWALRTRKP
jgi:type II secretory pathway pseudopilin PulG